MKLIHRLLYPRWRLCIQVRNKWINVGYHYFKRRAIRKGVDLQAANRRTVQIWGVFDTDTDNLYDWGPK